MNLMQKVEENKKVLASLYRVEQENLYMSMRPISIVGREIRESIQRDGVALHGAVVKKPRSTSTLNFLIRCRAFLGFK